MYREMPKFKPDELLEYLRKSRSDDPSLTVEEVLEKHETILNDWAERNLDSPIPSENVYKEVVSGETISDRPEFQKLLKRIESSRIRAILVVEIPRLSRGDLEDCGRIIKLLRYTNTLVITPQRIYDLQDEFDREGFERELKSGNYYLEYQKKLMKRGIDYAVQEQGAYVGSLPPYGYSKIKVAVGKKKVPTLEIVEEEAKIVRMIFDWYLNENLGFQRIADRLDGMGVPPRKVKCWSNQSIKKILENEHYTGKIRYYAHKMSHEVKDLTVTKKKIAVKDYKLFDGMHDAIIDEETFYRAKAKRDSMPRVQKDKKLRNPLASILYCECGHAMTYALKRGIPRFECPEQRRCGNASIDASQLMEMICDAIHKNIENFSVELDESNEDVIKKHEEQVAYLKKKLKDIEKKELSLWEKYTEESMPQSIFNNLREKFNEEKENAEKALENAISNMPKRIDYKKHIATFHEALNGMSNKDMSAEAKNNLLKACIEKIEYSREGATRGSREEAKDGKSYERGWIQSEPVIEITLKL
jgi:DNA invertase Pin-like site-specific DNA recombinase